MATDVTITVEARTIGMWRVKLALLALRCVRPKRLAARLTCWLIDDKFGADIKVGLDGRWERGCRVEMKPGGD